MKTKNNLYLLLAFLGGTILCAPLCAQQVYTLDECIGMALQNNVRIKNARNDLKAAELQKKSAFSNYFPSVSAAGMGFVADKGILQMEMLPGTELSLLKDGVAGGVTAVLPLFSGGQIVNGSRLAQVNVEASRLKNEMSEDEVRFTVEQYFWQVAMLKEKRRTLHAMEEQLHRICCDAEAAVEAGVANRNDLLQAKLRANEVNSSLISVENALGVARRLLGQYMGCTEDSIDVAWEMDGGLPESPNGLFCPPETALLSTAEYNLLHKDLDANRLQYKATLGKNLPAIAIGGGYVYDNWMDKDHSFWVGGVTVSVPLTKWWGGSQEMKRQKLQVRNAENRLKDQSELLLIRMENSWNALTDAYKQIGIAMESIRQAQENLRLQSDYYHAGTCTMSDLLEAQSLYRQSCDQYVESYAQYEIKKCQYLQATGR